MNTKLNRRTIFGTLTAGALALSMAACGGSGDDAGGEGDLASGEIIGSGASFPDAFYAAAIEAYAEVNPELVVTYSAEGSSAGKEAFGQDLNDFAGTDSLVRDGDGPDRRLLPVRADRGRPDHRVVQPAGVEGSR